MIADERRGDHPNETLGQSVSLVDAGDVLAQHQELVAAEPSHRVAGPNRL